MKYENAFRSEGMNWVQWAPEDEIEEHLLMHYLFHAVSACGIADDGRRDVRFGLLVANETYMRVEKDTPQVIDGAIKLRLDAQDGSELFRLSLIQCGMDPELMPVLIDSQANVSYLTPSGLVWDRQTVRRLTDLGVDLSSGRSMYKADLEA